LRFNIMAESNSFEMLRGLVLRGNMISFQIEIGAPAGKKGPIVRREIDDRDVPSGKLVLGRLRERNLPVPTAVFAERLARSLSQNRNNLETAA